ncbi:mannosidase-like protein [Asticcacaulis biprosthecium C19]|uniref:Mannosidase-like protein n=2 Tax=Asticcacaulis biprosthecium TaxID=76891 RepID=F4QPX2_9CAUL|nr:mannosidase-like protein [Asticcacaulis biprosthecium C19]
MSALVLAPLRAVAATRSRKEVLAFYYGWYRTKDPQAHWQNPGSPNTPVTGPYDSQDDVVIARHVQQAKTNGITGFIASWWGPGDPTDQQLPKLLDAATKTDLKVCAYVENATTPEALAEQVLYLHAKHTGHKQWLTLDGRKVVFLYDRVLQTIGLDGWKRARKLIETKAPKALAFITTGNGRNQIAERAPHVDGVHIYDMAFYLSQKHDFEWLWQRQFYSGWIGYQAGLKVKTATILPGFDDRLVPDRPKPRPVVARDNGKLFRALWDAAIAADPDWILIVSFNEWHEGSEIEPSQRNGDRELLTCRQKSARFLR